MQNKNILVVDIGNTNIVLGFFEGDKLSSVHRIETDKNSGKNYNSILKEIIKNTVFDGCVIASVVDEITEKMQCTLKEILGFEPILLTHKTNLNIKIKTPAPETVGADRLANVFAACNYQLPAIVVDIGTAVTFDVVTKNREFIGGVIMPGLKTQLKSLCDNTSKLPEIRIKDSEYAIGNTTESCILSGVVRGLACAIDGLLAQCENEFGEQANIIVTGGNGEFLAKYMKRKPDYIEPNLTLLGLRDIYRYLSKK